MINVDNEDLPQKSSGMDPGIFVVDNFLTEEEEATILSLMSTGTPDTGKTLSFKLSPAPHFLM
jgi:multisubunit Na+/H+ antiporter MnhE subunit